MEARVRICTYVFGTNFRGIVCGCVSGGTIAFSKVMLRVGYAPIFTHEFYPCTFARVVPQIGNEVEISTTQIHRK